MAAEIRNRKSLLSYGNHRSYLFFFFFLNYSTFKSKGMHVGTGFWRAILIRINFLASNLIYRILYLRKTLYRERI